MDQLIQFAPGSLRFDITLQEQTYTNLRVRNVSGERLAFKVKTTCVQRYLVRPSCALIDPDAIVDVAFGLKSFAAPPADLHDCRDRFQLLVARLSDVPRGLDDGADDLTHGFVSAQALWSSVPSSVVHREKLPVELHLVSSESPAKPKSKLHTSVMLQAATLPSVSITPDTSTSRESRSLPQTNPAPDPSSPLSDNSGTLDPPPQQLAEGNTAGALMANAVLAAMRAKTSSVAAAPSPMDDEPVADTEDTTIDDQYDEDEESLAVPYAMQPGNGFSSFAAVAAAVSSKPKSGLDALSNTLGSLAKPKADKAVPEIGDVPVPARYIDDEDDDESAKTPIPLPTPPAAPSTPLMPSFAQVAELAQHTMANAIPESVLPPPPTSPPPTAPPAPPIAPPITPPSITSAPSATSPPPKPAPVLASQSPVKSAPVAKSSVDKPSPAPAPAPASASKSVANRSSSTTTPIAGATAASSQPAEKEPEDSIDYTSIEYARERVLDINVTHVTHVPELDRVTRYRVAVERAGELSRVIEHKLRVIDNLHKQLVEARNRLSDARLATHPAYDVNFEISESGRIPISHLCVMWLITCALLQLLL